jgi:ribosome-associated toxin RatA of RatAB toxin-antitoxin module
MDSLVVRQVRADRAVVFDLAAAVEDWPRLLPHYRWVRVLEGDERSRLVEMAARRDVLGGLSIPLWWRARQRLDRAGGRIHFEHVEGVTRGMQVEWRLVPLGGGRVDVSIRHLFEPNWPVPDWLVSAIVGEYFVGGVAHRTLCILASLAEQRQAGA